jgi:hypothetical protein
MSYQLAGMQEAQAMEFSAVDYSCLPEFPTSVSDEELDYVDGCDDARLFMQGEISQPLLTPNVNYMAGWDWQITHYFNPEFLVKK